MSIDEWLNKAIAYFNGTLTIDEARIFEEETAASEELSDMMKLWKTTDAEAVVYEQNKDQADAFISTHQKLKAHFIKNDERQTTFPVWKWVAVAAAITGIIFIWIYVVPLSEKSKTVADQKTRSDSTKNITPADTSITLKRENGIKEKGAVQETSDSLESKVLYAQAFTPDDVPENPNGPMDDAFFYYASAQYKKAIIAIDSLENKELTRGNSAISPLTKFYAAYYKALSMMSLGNEAAAIPLLKQSVQLSPSETFKVKAQWYLALAYLNQNNISQTNNTLRLLMINPSSGSYKSKAEKLYKALNK